MVATNPNGKSEPIYKNMATNQYNGALYKKIRGKKAVLLPKDYPMILLSYLFQLEILQSYTFSAKKNITKRRVL